ncbi:hypothetical protein KIN20_014168 [Parelaphostrongylus tenuis]|uniref:Uncharacterized protein n=1 Tax=Parelaphostrongylus tenuis TaxID=148309 RepID=A0AAD5MYL3_PARTN|nr:hypothetical protein KIN20_014168 [Parelaphostrongylus tenuis]
MDSEANLLVRACNQLGTFLAHRETESSVFGIGVDVFVSDRQNFPHETVKKHQETIINSPEDRKSSNPVRTTALEISLV